MSGYQMHLTKSDVIEVLFRHKWKIILLPMLIFAAAVFVILFFPRSYRSEARLALRLGRETMGVDPTATSGSTINMTQNTRDSEVKSAIEIITSRAVIGRAVDLLGPDFVIRGGEGSDVKGNPIIEAAQNALGNAIKTVKQIDPISDREEAIIKIEKKFKVHAERTSTVLVAALDTKSAAGAQKILQTLCEVYQEEHLRIHRNPESGEFFSDQLALLQAKLDDAQQKLRDEKNRNGLTSLEGKRSSLEQEITSVELETYRVEQEIATSSARRVDLQSQLASIPEREMASKKSIPNEGADLLREQLYVTQTRLMDLKARLKENHPSVVAAAAQVEEAKGVVDAQESQREEVTDDINPVHRSLALDLFKEESILAGLESRLSQLKKQRAKLISDLETFNRNELLIDHLQREEQLARGKYFQYANSLEQSRIDEALETGRVSGISIAQGATLAEKPVTPNKLLVLIAAMALSLASVVGMVVLSEIVDDRLRTEYGVENAIGAPVLVSIPENARMGRVLSR